VIQRSHFHDPARFLFNVPLKGQCFGKKLPGVGPRVVSEGAIGTAALGEHNGEAGHDGVVQGVDALFVAHGDKGREKDGPAINC
jgi:hypothetical protein